jgi:hypothetical protein
MYEDLHNQESTSTHPWVTIALNLKPNYRIKGQESLLQLAAWSERKAYCAGAFNIFHAVLGILTPDQAFGLRCWLQELEDVWFCSPLGTEAPWPPYFLAPDPSPPSPTPQRPSQVKILAKFTVDEGYSNVLRPVFPSRGSAAKAGGG